MSILTVLVPVLSFNSMDVDLKHIVGAVIIVLIIVNLVGVHYFPANDKAKGYAVKIANYMTEAWMTEVKVREAESEIKIN